MGTEVLLKCMYAIGDDSIATMKQLSNSGVQIPRGKEGHNLRKLYEGLSQEYKSILVAYWHGRDRTVGSVADIRDRIRKIGPNVYRRARYGYESRTNPEIPFAELSDFAVSVMDTILDLKGGELYRLRRPKV